MGGTKITVFFGKVQSTDIRINFHKHSSRAREIKSHTDTHKSRPSVYKPVDVARESSRIEFITTEHVHAAARGRLVRFAGFLTLALFTLLRGFVFLCLLDKWPLTFRYFRHVYIFQCNGDKSAFQCCFGFSTQIRCFKKQQT